MHAEIVTVLETERDADCTVMSEVQGQKMARGQAERVVVDMRQVGRALSISYASYLFSPQTLEPEGPIRGDGEAVKLVGQARSPLQRIRSRAEIVPPSSSVHSSLARDTTKSILGLLWYWDGPVVALASE